MKICMPHWADLRAAIHTKGLSQLGSTTKEGAEARIKAELDGTADDSTYDPLLAANNMIWGEALRLGGLYLMGTKPDGSDYCPLCEARDRGGQDPAEWIDGCTDSIRKYCEEHGLIRSN